MISIRRCLALAATAAISTTILNIEDASAAILNGTYSFSISNFYTPSGATPPYSTISGTFTFHNFDTTVAYDSNTTVVTLDSLTPGFLGSPFGVTSFTSGIYAGNVFLGGTANNSDYALDGTNDIALGFDFSNPAAPTFLPCSAIYSCSNPPGETIVGSGYTTANTTAYFQPQSASASISLVPLPASAPMFGAAFLALGAVGYGLKRKRAAAA